MPRSKQWGVRLYLRDGTTRLLGPFSSRAAASAAAPGGATVLSSTVFRFHQEVAGPPRVIGEKKIIPASEPEPPGPEPTWVGDAQGAILNGLPSFLFIDIFGRDNDANLIDPELVGIRVHGNNGGPNVTEDFAITDPYYDNYIRTQPGALQQFGIDNPNITLVELLNGLDEVQQALVPSTFDDDWAQDYNTAGSGAVNEVTVVMSASTIGDLAGIRLQDNSGNFRGAGPDNMFTTVNSSNANSKAFACPGSSGFSNDILWLFHSSGFAYRVGESFSVQ